ncbi:MAG TPA: hypothetical protein PLQ93_05365 [Bacteroidia bacterium]|nr:hypothetical protein [Bacteroidia bacterium]
MTLSHLVRSQAKQIRTILNLVLSGMLLLFCLACNEERAPQQTEPPKPITSPVQSSDSTREIAGKARIAINDSLDELAGIIAGTLDSSSYFPAITASSAYKAHRRQFSKRWNHFDSIRVSKIRQFHDSELVNQVVMQEDLFYPFSGPDYLYAGLFFPEARRYLLVGLEPCGSPDPLVQQRPDSLSSYFSALNRSLNAILKFSFFRTNSMEEDLRSSKLDGVMHLLFLFLKREGNRIVSLKTIGIDSTGQIEALPDSVLTKGNSRGLEIRFLNPNDSEKVLQYFSLNLSDPGMRKHSGLQRYLLNKPGFNTYLKGASYLLHKPYFSRIRSCILQKSKTIVQDDSGIALHYFLAQGNIWRFRLYGEYAEPISLFRKSYQPALDSMYKSTGSQRLGFGIGYNFKDNNSNLMIAIRK